MNLSYLAIALFFIGIWLLYSNLKAIKSANRDIFDCENEVKSLKSQIRALQYRLDELEKTEKTAKKVPKMGKKPLGNGLGAVLTQL